jgi:hypothetical protein
MSVEPASVREVLAHPPSSPVVSRASPVATPGPRLVQNSSDPTPVRSLSQRLASLPGMLFSVAVVALLVLGWWERDEYWFSAEEGWGYAFGIIGVSMMALLLLYPARKHWKPMRNFLPIRYWFQLHMLLGIAGPVFILFHSNFQLGSLNSNMALFSMLTVAASGIIGRYVYRQIHRGLYGAQIEFKDLRVEYEASRQRFIGNELVDEKTARRLQKIELTLIDRSLSLRGSLWARHAVRRLRTAVARRLSGALHSGSLGAEQIQALKASYAGWRLGTDRLERMARYAVFARLFSLWHVLHLPIFFLMLIAAVIHIVVVHMY